MADQKLKLCASSDSNTTTCIECCIETGEVLSGDLEEFLLNAEMHCRAPAGYSTTNDALFKLVVTLLERLHTDEVEFSFNVGEATIIRNWLDGVLSSEGASDDLFTIGVYESALEMFTSKRKNK